MRAVTQTEVCATLRMTKIYLSLLIVTMFILILLITSVAAQSNGQQKPYQQWTLADAQKVLSDSPWALTRSRERIGPPLPSGIAFDSGSVTVRLRSSLPIRQALLRLRQLRGKYDQMGAAEKASFDNKMKALLECPACADNYVVTLSPPFDRHSGVPFTLREMTVATLKNFVEIANEHGETRKLVHFEPPKSQGAEAVFFFSRFNEKGVPLLTPLNKKLVISFDPRIFSTNVAVPMRFEFDVSKIVLNEGVVF